MDAAALSPAQRDELFYALAARRDWLLKLRERMDARGWRKDDAFYVAVCAAWDATQAALRALVASEPKEPEAPPEPRPWMDRPAEPTVIMPGASTGSMPWVGKRGKSRRRR